MTIPDKPKRRYIHIRVEMLPGLGTKDPAEHALDLQRLIMGGKYDDPNSRSKLRGNRWRLSVPDNQKVLTLVIKPIPNRTGNGEWGGKLALTNSIRDCMTRAGVPELFDSFMGAPRATDFLGHQPDDPDEVGEQKCLRPGSQMDNRLPIWTIYQHPKDYPGEFVARKFMNDEPSGEILRRPSLPEIREALPGGLVRLDRHPSDDPVIVECWL